MPRLPGAAHRQQRGVHTKPDSGGVCVSTSPISARRRKRTSLRCEMIVFCSALAACCISKTAAGAPEARKGPSLISLPQTTIATAWDFGHSSVKGIIEAKGQTLILDTGPSINFGPIGLLRKEWGLLKRWLSWLARGRAMRLG